MFSVSIGLGVFGYGILFLGFTGILFPWVILLLLILAALIARKQFPRLTNRFIEFPSRVIPDLAKTSRLQKGFLVGGGVLVFLTFTHALTPPWDPDGLIYHLQIPRLWLDSHSIQPIANLWESNYPLSIELIYSIGLALGSESFAKLTHLSLAVLLILATYSASRRFLPSRSSWLSPAILAGTPILPVWASSSSRKLRRVDDEKSRTLHNRI